MLLAAKPDQRVTMWTPLPENARVLRETRENTRFLPGVRVPESIEITEDFKGARDADAFVFAVPTIYLRSVLRRLKGDWRGGSPVVSVIKGIEQETFQTPTEIIAGELDVSDRAVLTGPSHAEELARRKPASVVAASDSIAFAEAVQRAFGSDRFRVYSSDDARGAELGGALKNVIAIAAGICDGLELGDNAKSALVTRGLVELVRVGVALGGKEETFYGLAGLGDLLTTAFSKHSRNRRVGEEVGRGKTLDAFLASTQQVAEGVWTAKSVHALAAKRGVSTPVTDEVHHVLFSGKDPRQAVNDLMSREQRRED